MRQKFLRHCVAERQCFPGEMISHWHNFLHRLSSVLRQPFSGKYVVTTKVIEDSVSQQAAGSSFLVPTKRSTLCRWATIHYSPGPGREILFFSGNNFLQSSFWQNFQDFSHAEQEKCSKFYRGEWKCSGHTAARSSTSQTWLKYVRKLLERLIRKRSNCLRIKVSWRWDWIF